MEIEARVFPRQDIDQLGIAPMSSMFWFSETVKPTAIDWRPEVHDSDGLAIWTGAGEYIWRPLNDPAAPSVSHFDDKTPRGFGLLQRDRIFDHYLDGVRYDRRPSLWVEPLDDWGEGAVQLVELPSNDETEDNIVAMWVPKQPVKAGASLRFRYRLQWSATEPHPTDLARCVATRLGRGGEPGKPRPKGVHKFMVEFLGGPLAALPFGVKPKPVLWSSSGTLLLCIHGGRAGRRTGTLARPIRFHRRRSQSRSTCGCISRTATRLCPRPGYISSISPDLPQARHMASSSLYGLVFGGNVSFFFCSINSRNAPPFGSPISGSSRYAGSDMASGRLMNFTPFARYSASSSGNIRASNAPTCISSTYLMSRP